MTSIQYTIPLLALLVSIGIGNVVAQEIPGGEELASRDVGPLGDVGAYVESLKLDESFQEMTLEEQETYIQSANKFISSGNAYELARNELLVKASEITIQVHMTNDVQRLEELKIEYNTILEQLEEFGVGTTEKTQENPDYYFEKYEQALEIYMGQDGQASVKDIHTDDVSLRNPGSSASLYSSLGSRITVGGNHA